MPLYRLEAGRGAHFINTASKGARFLHEDASFKFIFYIWNFWYIMLWHGVEKNKINKIFIFCDFGTIFISYAYILIRDIIDPPNLDNIFSLDCWGLLCHWKDGLTWSNIAN